MDAFTLGNGSNDVLELWTFAGPGDEVVYAEFAFAVYAIVTQVSGATAVVVPAKDWAMTWTRWRQPLRQKPS